MINRIISCIIIICFTTTSIIPPSYAQSINALNLPVPGAMVLQSPAYVPVLLKGMTIHPDNPFQFDFIIDSGNSALDADEVKKETEKLVKYFLAAMTVPQDDLWVNLSPYEKDRIIPDELGKTALGRDLLAQDYILKQLTASMMYPEDELGKKFWKRVQRLAREKYGINEVPTDLFNKVWILPESASVYEYDRTVYVVNSRMKVMLEEDYLAYSEERIADSSDQNKESSNLNAKRLPLHAAVIRELILPEIEREINQGKNFAPLRQIYHSLILAKWYKQNIKNSLLSKVYADQNKVDGIETGDEKITNEIYNRYMQAYEKGVFSFIKEDYDAISQTIIPRKYFSGGFHDTAIIIAPTDNADMAAFAGVGDRYQATARVIADQDSAAMDALAKKEAKELKQLGWQDDFAMLIGKEDKEDVEGFADDAAALVRKYMILMNLFDNNYFAQQDSFPPEIGIVIAVFIIYVGVRLAMAVSKNVDRLESIEQEMENLEETIPNLSGEQKQKAIQKLRLLKRRHKWINDKVLQQLGKEGVGEIQDDPFISEEELDEMSRNDKKDDAVLGMSVDTGETIVGLSGIDLANLDDEEYEIMEIESDHYPEWADVVNGPYNKGGDMQPDYYQIKVKKDNKDDAVLKEGGSQNTDAAAMAEDVDADSAFLINIFLIFIESVINSLRYESTRSRINELITFVGQEEMRLKREFQEGFKKGNIEYSNALYELTQEVNSDLGKLYDYLIYPDKLKKPATLDEVNLLEEKYYGNVSSKGNEENGKDDAAMTLIEAERSIKNAHKYSIQEVSAEMDQIFFPKKLSWVTKALIGVGAVAAVVASIFYAPILLIPEGLILFWYGGKAFLNHNAIFVLEEETITKMIDKNVDKKKIDTKIFQELYKYGDPDILGGHQVPGFLFKYLERNLAKRDPEFYAKVKYVYDYFKKGGRGEENWIVAERLQTMIKRFAYFYDRSNLQELWKKISQDKNVITYKNRLTSEVVSYNKNQVPENILNERVYDEKVRLVLQGVLLTEIVEYASAADPYVHWNIKSVKEEMLSEPELVDFVSVSRPKIIVSRFIARGELKQAYDEYSSVALLDLAEQRITGQSIEERYEQVRQLPRPERKKIRNYFHIGVVREKPMDVEELHQFERNRNILAQADNSLADRLEAYENIINTEYANFFAQQEAAFIEEAFQFFNWEKIPNDDPLYAVYKHRKTNEVRTFLFTNIPPEIVEPTIDPDKPLNKAAQETDEGTLGKGKDYIVATVQMKALVNNESLNNRKAMAEIVLGSMKNPDLVESLYTDLVNDESRDSRQQKGDHILHVLDVATKEDSLIRKLVHNDVNERELATAGVDILMIPGNSDINALTKIMHLYQQGIGNKILISGKKGRATADLRKMAEVTDETVSEADLIRILMIKMAEEEGSQFANIAKDLKNDDIVLIEPDALYTVQNFTKSIDLMKDGGLFTYGQEQTILYMHTPLQQLRTKGQFNSVIAKYISEGLLEEGQIKPVSYTVDYQREETTLYDIVGETFRLIANYASGDWTVEGDLKILSAQNWKDAIALHKELTSDEKNELSEEMGGLLNAVKLTQKELFSRISQENPLIGVFVKKVIEGDKAMLFKSKVLPMLTVSLMTVCLAGVCTAGAQTSFNVDSIRNFVPDKVKMPTQWDGVKEVNVTKTTADFIVLGIRTSIPGASVEWYDNNLYVFLENNGTEKMSITNVDAYLQWDDTDVGLKAEVGFIEEGKDTNKPKTTLRSGETKGLIVKLPELLKNLANRPSQIALKIERKRSSANATSAIRQKRPLNIHDRDEEPYYIIFSGLNDPSKNVPTGDNEPYILKKDRATLQETDAATIVVFLKTAIKILENPNEHSEQEILDAIRKIGWEIARQDYDGSYNKYVLPFLGYSNKKIHEQVAKLFLSYPSEFTAEDLVIANMAAAKNGHHPYPWQPMSTLGELGYWRAVRTLKNNLAHADKYVSSEAKRALEQFGFMQDEIKAADFLTEKAMNAKKTGDEQYLNDLWDELQELTAEDKMFTADELTGEMERYNEDSLPHTAIKDAVDFVGEMYLSGDYRGLEYLKNTVMNRVAKEYEYFSSTMTGSNMGGTRGVRPDGWYAEQTPQYELLSEAIKKFELGDLLKWDRITSREARQAIQDKLKPHAYDAVTNNNIQKVIDIIGDEIYRAHEKFDVIYHEAIFDETGYAEAMAWYEIGEIDASGPPASLPEEPKKEDFTTSVRVEVIKKDDAVLGMSVDTAETIKTVAFLVITLGLALGAPLLGGYLKFRENKVIKGFEEDWLALFNSTGILDWQEKRENAYYNIVNSKSKDRRHQIKAKLVKEQFDFLKGELERINETLDTRYYDKMSDEQITENIFSLLPSAILLAQNSEKFSLKYTMYDYPGFNTPNVSIDEWARAGYLLRTYEPLKDLNLTVQYEIYKKQILKKADEKIVDEMWNRGGVSVYVHPPVLDQIKRYMELGENADIELKHIRSLISESANLYETTERSGYVKLAIDIVDKRTQGDNKDVTDRVFRVDSAVLGQKADVDDFATMSSADFFTVLGVAMVVVGSFGILLGYFTKKDDGDNAVLKEAAKGPADDAAVLDELREEVQRIYGQSAIINNTQIEVTIPEIKLDQVVALLDSKGIELQEDPTQVGNTFGYRIRIFASDTNDLEQAAKVLIGAGRKAAFNEFSNLRNERIELTEQDVIPARAKLDPDSLEFKEFRGNTVIVRFDDRTQSQLVDVKRAIEQDINEAGLRDKLAFVDEDSFHMTFKDLVNPDDLARIKERNIEYQGKPQQDVEKIVVQKVKTAFEQLHDTKAFDNLNFQITELGSFAPFLLLALVEPQNRETVKGIDVIRTVISKRTDIHAQFPFVGHITFAYIANPMTEQEYAPYKGIVNKHMNGLNIGFDINLQRDLELATFETMDRYDTVFTPQSVSTSDTKRTTDSFLEKMPDFDHFYQLEDGRGDNRAEISSFVNRFVKGDLFQERNRYKAFYAESEAEQIYVLDMQKSLLEEKAKVLDKLKLLNDYLGEFRYDQRERLIEKLSEVNIVQDIFEEVSSQAWKEDGNKREIILYDEVRKFARKLSARLHVLNLKEQWNEKNRNVSRKDIDRAVEEFLDLDVLPLYFSQEQIEYVGDNMFYAMFGETKQQLVQERDRFLEELLVVHKYRYALDADQARRLNIVLEKISAVDDITAGRVNFKDRGSSDTVVDYLDLRVKAREILYVLNNTDAAVLGMSDDTFQTVLLTTFVGILFVSTFGVYLLQDYLNYRNKHSKDSFQNSWQKMMIRDRLAITTWKQKRKEAYLEVIRTKSPEKEDQALARLAKQQHDILKEKLEKINASLNTKDYDRLNEEKIEEYIFSLLPYAIVLARNGESFSLGYRMHEYPSFHTPNVYMEEVIHAGALLNQYRTSLDAGVLDTSVDTGETMVDLAGIDLASLDDEEYEIIEIESDHYPEGVEVVNGPYNKGGDTQPDYYQIKVKKDGKDDAVMTDVGGIDMNDIEVERQGSGVTIDFDPAALEDFGNVRGFTPVIINFVPLPSVLPLLGLAPRQEEEEYELSAIEPAMI